MASVMGTTGGGIINRAISGQAQTLDAVQRDIIGGTAGFVGAEVIGGVTAKVFQGSLEELSNAAIAARTEAAEQSLGQGADKAFNQAANTIRTTIQAATVAGGETISNVTSESTPPVKKAPEDKKEQQ